MAPLTRSKLAKASVTAKSLFYTAALEDERICKLLKIKAKLSVGASKHPFVIVWASSLSGWLITALTRGRQGRGVGVGSRHPTSLTW